MCWVVYMSYFNAVIYINLQHTWCQSSKDISQKTQHHYDNE